METRSVRKIHRLHGIPGLQVHQISTKRNRRFMSQVLQGQTCNEKNPTRQNFLCVRSVPELRLRAMGSTEREEMPGLYFPSRGQRQKEDRKSTRLNSSHSSISYAVFCLKKKPEKCHGSCVYSAPPHGRSAPAWPSHCPRGSLWHRAETFSATSWTVYGHYAPGNLAVPFKPDDKIKQLTNQ